METGYEEKKARNRNTEKRDDKGEKGMRKTGVKVTATVKTESTFGLFKILTVHF